jgi:Protein of unknown function (DUF3489)
MDQLPFEDLIIDDRANGIFRVNRRAIEALPEPQSDAKRTSKQDEVIAMLRRPEGTTVDEVARATGW